MNTTTDYLLTDALGSELTTKVTFTQLSKSANEQNAIRQKPQSNGMWGEAIIQVMYDVPNNRIQVWKFEGKAWVQVGNDIPVRFVDGDVFTVYANKDGTVEIYRAESLLSTRQPVDLQVPTPTVTLTPAKKDASAPELVNIVPVNFKLPVSAPQQQSGSVTITYDYDPLYRLTEANYSTGDYYHYTYDAVGNRLTQTTQLAVTNYQYDDANRLTSVNGVPYTWDNNGNLLNDGVNTYTYDSANRLTSFNGTSSYAYNGLGDRLQQSVNGNTITYTLDLNTGLTQVLNDGTNTYLYGVGRIAQVNTTTEYFLGDALGSVRQMTDASGEITLAKSYAPYGEVVNSAGGAVSPFAFTGEQQDVSGLTYLRARYYSSGDGRFLTRDTWMGDYNSPLSLNRWNYTISNPINYTDPSGQCPQGWIPNPDGTCTFTLFPSLFSGGWVITIPDVLSGLFCEEQDELLFPIYATPTTTPQPYTPTPGSINITPTPGSVKVTPTITNTPSPKYTKIKVYRGLKGTAPSDIKPRIDTPEKELMELGAIGSFSVFEQIPPSFGFTHELPFEITYQEPKIVGRIGTVVGLVAGEVIFSGGIALYAPDPSIPIYGEGHWSITVVGLSKDELRNKVAEYGKKYFGK